ncbi:response regulator [Mucilaginibacter pallidiroseus]|uniref:histidine kinase n=1 Tax=Mucilaginibacter pallidiroseus TaxID=2599295 RepID=A0A563U567_9SPHI|nr:ATP-binding protein [Mucilaginibacter pallidiroseus]TWR26452.1 response regulator [Mucilaginibacter pallidiroseus]
MITGFKRTSFLRYGLIVVLIVVLFGSAFYLYLHYSKAEKVRTTFQKMITARENSALIDSCIIELYSADNSSRMFALTGKTYYSKEFSRQIKDIRKIISNINANDKSAIDLGVDKGLQDLISQKALKTDSYIRLMTLSDSLMKSASKINESLRKNEKSLVKRPVLRRIKTRVQIDTVKPVAAVAAAKPVKEKKGFFGKVFSVFSKKDKQVQEAKKQPVLVERRTDTVITTMTVLPAVSEVYGKYYDKIYQTNNRLRANEREMLEINNRLINQIINSLKKYKVAEHNYIASSKTEMNSNLATVLYEYRKISGLMFLLMTTVVVILLYNIWKIFKDQEELVVYTEKAEIHAQSKSRFMANMSHEIRTPLNSIIGFSEQLTQSKLTEEQSEQIYAIRSSSKMLLDVVNEILDFSKYETGKMSFDSTPFSPYEAIEEIATSMRVQANKKNILLKRDIEFKKSLVFNGDYHRLKQVVMNLVGNAIKFTAQGSVTVKAFLTDDSNRSGFKMLNVSIRDTGVGIDAEHMPYIFDEFSQVKSAQKVSKQPGTGLGLAISKKIVELQGGSIKVASRVGKGTIFSFKIPFEVSTVEAYKVNSDGDDMHQQANIIAGKRVLVADDNKLNVLLVSTILKKWNVSFDTACDGRQALQKFEDNNYDVILTDIEMPEMGGIELSQVIRANGNETKASVPILALTANVLKEDRDKYLSVGITGVVLKPFTEKNLIDNIASAMLKKQLMPDKWSVN